MAKPSISTALTRKISLLIILVSLTPLIVVGGLFAHLFHTAYRDKTVAHLKELTSKHRQIVDEHLNERLATIQTIMDASTPENLSSSNYLKDLLYTLHSQYGRDFVDIGLVDDKGELLAYAGPFHLGGAQYAQSVWFKKAMANDHYISDVFLGIRNQPHFIVAACRDYKGRSYILRATIDFETFTRLVENIRIGETGHAFIINRQGEFQTQPRGDVSHCKGKLLELVQKSFPQKPVVGPKLTVIEGGTCNTGETSVFVLALLKQGSWLLIYKQDSTDAFRDLYNARLLVLSVVALGALGIIITALLLTRRVVNFITRLDEDKEKMNDQVLHASKMASLGEMAAGIAHEINNPLAIMVEETGWIQDLIEDAQQGDALDMEEIQRALAQVKTQGSRCKDITQKMLSFARKTDPQRKTMDVNSQIEKTVDLAASKARFANVHIDLKLESRPLHVEASPSEMQQVLLNLINNSLDAMELEGGLLEIRTRVAEKMIEILVSDDGPGIPDANLQKLFDPFFTTKPVGRGTGLGLAVCYGLVKNMGGDITVTSCTGQGTCFRILLPQASSSVLHVFSAGQNKGEDA